MTAGEYAEAFDVEMNTAYEHLQFAGKKLADRMLTYYSDEKKESINWMRWVGRAKYHNNEGWIELHWWHELLPHLFRLRSQFTSYKLAQASALRSVYSWRLLELLSQHAGEDSEGKLRIGWYELTAALQVPPSCQSRFNNFKRRILLPALAELRDKDGWVISWEPLRTGRKLTGMYFDFERNPQQYFELEN